MPANPIHHGPTVDVPWDGPAEEAKLASPVTKARGNGMYAWHDASGADGDGDGYPDAKADSKFPHHMVDAQGEPGDANVAGCRAINQRVGQSSIPIADQADVSAHAQAHMDDHDQSMMGESADVPLGALVVPRSYRHVTKALHERPWAIQPQVLTFMVDLLRNRVAGVVLSAEEIDERIAAARTQGGDRTGGAIAGSVAVIPMYGLITQRESLMSSMSGGTSIDELRSLLRSALVDPAVQAVVFDIDSPGGSVDGVPEFAAELRGYAKGAKPIVAQVNTLCASAALWLASSMTEIVCTPSGEVGSIGVYAAHEDVSQAEQMAGVKTTLISAGPYKTEGNPFEPLADEARAAIQEQVDTFYSMFLSDVARGRGTTVEAVSADYGQGRTLLARKAKAAGMVDRIDTLEATVLRFQPAKATGRAGAAVIPINRAATAAPVGRPDPGWNQRMLAKGTLR
jgi:signal peptide peptidase SppA